MMARAATAAELVKFRKDGQHTQLYLTIHQPTVWFQARVNQASITLNDLTQITYDTVTTGAYNTSIFVGMTVYFGSTSGAYDLGMARINKAATATEIYFGRISDLKPTDNAYITVVEEFGLWAKHPLVTADTTFMDAWVEYSDQHSKPAPVPVMGPDAVIWLTGATVTFSPSAADSWCPGGSITSYQWSVVGASSTANMTTATPTFTFNSAGCKWFSCTVTSNQGVTATGMRHVWVHSAASMPTQQFALKYVRGDTGSAGWAFSVDLWDEATQALVRDRAQVILHAVDYYGADAGSIGPLTGYENVIAVGWIAEETIRRDPNISSVCFNCYGPQYWLDREVTFPIGLEEGTASDWLHLTPLNLDWWTWHISTWRSTASAVIDIYPPGDTRRASALTVGSGSVWAALSYADTKILASPICDRYGRLFIQIDSQYLSDRSGVPVVIDVTEQDYNPPVDIERVVMSDVSRLEISGVAWDGTTGTPILSAAAGSIFKRYGRSDKRDELVLSDQTTANTLSGLMLGQINNDYPRIGIRLASNNRLVDIAPLQYLTMSMAAGDTPRGVTWTTKKLIPRSVEYSHNPASGVMLTQVECEGESFAENSVTVERPQTPEENTTPEPGESGGSTTLPETTLPETTLPYLPPTVELPDCSGDGDAGAVNGPWSLGVTGELTSAQKPMIIKYPCWIRGSSASNRTRYEVRGVFMTRDVSSATLGEWVETTSDDWYQVDAVDAGGFVVARGVHDPVTNKRVRTGTFDNTNGMSIYGIKISFNIDRFQISSITLHDDASGTAYSRTTPYYAIGDEWNPHTVPATILPYTGGYFRDCGVLSTSCNVYQLDNTIYIKNWEHQVSMCAGPGDLIEKYTIQAHCRPTMEFHFSGELNPKPPNPGLMGSIGGRWWSFKTWWSAAYAKTTIGGDGTPYSDCCSYRCGDSKPCHPITTCPQYNGTGGFLSVKFYVGCGSGSRTDLNDPGAGTNSWIAAPGNTNLIGSRGMVVDKEIFVDAGSFGAYFCSWLTVDLFHYQVQNTGPEGTDSNWTYWFATDWEITPAASRKIRFTGVYLKNICAA